MMSPENAWISFEKPQMYFQKSRSQIHSCLIKQPMDALKNQQNLEMGK